MAMVFCRGCGKELHETALACPHCGAQQISAKSTRSQSVAVVLAAFLGGLGIHRFYLGRTVSGILSLLFCWTGIPGMIAFVEIFVIAFTSPEKWAQKYNDGRLSRPLGGLLKAVVVIIPAIMFIGIVAAVAIPAYSQYVHRAQEAQLR